MPYTVSCTKYMLIYFIYIHKNIATPMCVRAKIHLNHHQILNRASVVSLEKAYEIYEIRKIKLLS